MMSLARRCRQDRGNISSRVGHLMRNELTLYKMVLTLLFWSCVGGLVVSHDYKLQQAMKYAERPLPSPVSPDSRIFLAMPTP
jgi:hypothetical protein